LILFFLPYFFKLKKEDCPAEYKPTSHTIKTYQTLHRV
jgi:hypothetical protein